MGGRVNLDPGCVWQIIPIVRESEAKLKQNKQSWKYGKKKRFSSMT
jgi:hypothetical protein